MIDIAYVTYGKIEEGKRLSIPKERFVELAEFYWSIRPEVFKAEIDELPTFKQPAELSILIDLDKLKEERKRLKEVMR